MMNRMAFNNYQSMNLVHKTKEGNELWLGDYYAASNVSLLKQKNIKSGKVNLIQFLPLQPCSESHIKNNSISIIRQSMLSIYQVIK